VNYSLYQKKLNINKIFFIIGLCLGSLCLQCILKIKKKLNVLINLYYISKIIVFNTFFNKNYKTIKLTF